MCTGEAPKTPGGSQAAPPGCGGAGAHPESDTAAATPQPDLVRGLHRTPKYLPCRFLYDERGSQLYEAITQLESYYPYRAEKQLLERHATAIASQFPAGSVVVECGCGDSTKTAILLQALLDRHGAGGVRFCGVDCSAEALRQTQHSLRRLVPGLPEAQVELVEAEYLQGVQEVRRRHPAAMLCMLWMGSSVGNFSHGEAVELLGALRTAAGERASLLLCTDMWKGEGALRRAYDDEQGVSAEFIVNGMQHALGTLGVPGAREPGRGRYEPAVNRELQPVEMWVTSQRRIPDALPGVHIEAGEAVLVEISRKFTPEGVAAMACAAGLVPCGGTWGSPSVYQLTLLLTPAAALQRCWADTDALFGRIHDWGAQPIDLRRPFGFYYGHCGAFAKSRLLLHEPASELDTMLSRGIDPQVSDPSRCHSHPAAPPEWPDRRQLAAYVAGVRRAVLAAVRGGGVHTNEGLSSDSKGSAAPAGFSMRALSMAVEHERQHHETLCYMLAQQRKADAAAAAAGSPPPVLGDGDGSDGDSAPLLPPEFNSPADAVQPFYLQQCSYAGASLAPPDCQDGGAAGAAPAPPATPSRADSLAGRLEALRLGGQPSSQPPASAAGEDGAGGSSFVCIPEGQVTLGVPPDSPYGFRWDAELGMLGPLAVPAVLVGAAPVTVAEFRRFVFEERGYQRRELWEPAAFEHFSASGHSMPATWALQGGQLWVHMPEASYRWEQVAACPVYVSLAEAQAYCRLHGARLMSEAEWALAAGSEAAAAGQVAQLEAGGWEWTATPFGPLPGFQADPLYPEYAQDFFDGEHAVLRGASPYTHPGIARRSFRNWFQRPYPYVFAKFRLARSPQEGAA